MSQWPWCCKAFDTAIKHRGFEDPNENREVAFSTDLSKMNDLLIVDLADDNQLKVEAPCSRSVGRCSRSDWYAKVML